MRMTKLLLQVCVASGLALASAGYAQAGPHMQEPETAIALAKSALAKHGISGDDFTDEYAEIVQSHAGITITTDVIVWFRVKQCPAGRLVVHMTPEYFVEEIYTLRQCKLDGIPAY